MRGKQVAMAVTYEPLTTEIVMTDLIVLWEGVGMRGPLLAKLSEVGLREIGEKTLVTEALHGHNRLGFALSSVGVAALKLTDPGGPVAVFLYENGAQPAWRAELIRAILASPREVRVFDWKPELLGGVFEIPRDQLRA